MPDGTATKNINKEQDGDRQRKKKYSTKSQLKTKIRIPRVFTGQVTCKRSPFYQSVYKQDNLFEYKEDKPS